MSCKTFHSGERIWAGLIRAQRLQIRGGWSPQTAAARLYTYHVTARKRKILVVDDDPGIRGSLSVLLQSWGFEPLQAANASEAVSIVEKQDPDIVISDVVMPETSGLELLRQLKAGDPHRPVLLITAQASIDNAVEAMKQGARDFLTKPLTDFPKLKALLDDAERELEMRRKARRLTARI